MGMVPLRILVLQLVTFIILAPVVHSRCVLAANAWNCQKICDLEAQCGAWTFDGNDGKCFLKYRYGWTVKPESNVYSGRRGNKEMWKNYDFEGADLPNIC